MTATITHTLGRFVWREVFTADPAATKRFYGALFGWTFEDVPMGPDWAYTLCKLGDKQIGGMMDLADMPEGSGDIPPHWALYVSVADVDATAARAKALGGQILGDCHDIPGVGRFAVLMDPQGAAISLFRATQGDPPEEATPALHDFCWESLSATDPAASIAFYEELIGWKARQMEGTDQPTKIFSRQGDAGTAIDVASVGQAPPGSPAFWGTFVAVADVLATAAKARELGGQVVVEKMEIPVGAFGVLQDPTGAMIYTFQAT